MKVLIGATGQPERVVRSADEVEIVAEASGLPLTAWRVIQAFPAGSKERKLARRWPVPETADRLADYFNHIVDDQSAERVALFNWLRDHDEERARDTVRLLDALNRYEIQASAEEVPDGWSVADELRVSGDDFTIVHNAHRPHKVARHPFIVAGVIGVLLFAALEVYGGRGRAR
jgi:hypothetical protein